MQLLPPPAEREWLLAELAALVAAAGAERFVAAPQILPDVEHFPDRWTPDASGVATLVRRVLAYAGLGDLDVRLELGHYRDAELSVDAFGRPREAAHSGTAAWFAGIRRGACVFGVDVKQLEEPDVLAAVLAHEVAHAFRRRHRLEADDRDLEERLTDLTTVYLGFGILTANASQRYRASGDMTHTQWSHSRSGYLSPQALSFALAAQVIARDRDGERSLVKDHLEANQAACFAAAGKALADEALADLLDLPPRADWPPPAPLPTVDRVRVDIEEEVAQEDEPSGVTFRLARSAPGGRALLAAGALTVGGIALIPVVGGFAAALGPITGAIALFALPRRRWDECADPGCAAELPEDTTRCPGCRGAIVGRVARRDDRLQARIDHERRR